MEHIINFCKNAESIFCNTKKIETLNDKVLEIDTEKVAIYRTRYSVDSSCIFSMELGTSHEKNMDVEMERLMAIERFYPGLFSYRYNGVHLEVIANVPMIVKYAGAIRRFGNSFNFIYLLRKRLNDILRMKNLITNDLTKPVGLMLLSTGSINLETNSYCVDLKNGEELVALYKRIVYGQVFDSEIKDLDMKFWSREINPDINKHDSKYHNEKKYELSDTIMNYYPPCIKRLAAQHKKGNYGRFLLATFLLGIHSEKDAKHQLTLMLSPEEAEHMWNGNCKDQWKTIVTRNYSPPSIKTMIDSGWFTEEDKIPPSLTNLEFYGYNPEV